MVDYRRIEPELEVGGREVAGLVSATVDQLNMCHWMKTRTEKSEGEEEREREREREKVCSSTGSH
jgi:hypothetical protein